MPYLLAINGGHGDDGADAIGIQKESDQEGEQIAIIPDLFESFSEPLETDLDRVQPLFVFLDTPGGFFDVAE